MSQRINLGSSPPGLYPAMLELEQRMSAAVAAAGLADGFAHLLRLRASQINKCAFCVRMHARDALASGESADRLALIAAWEEAGCFDARERAALALVEAITLVAVDQVPDAVYAQAVAVLSGEEIAAVEWLAVVINAWNRIAIAGRTPVEP